MLSNNIILIISHVYVERINIATYPETREIAFGYVFEPVEANIQ